MLLSHLLTNCKYSGNLSITITFFTKKVQKKKIILIFPALACAEISHFSAARGSA